MIPTRLALWLLISWVTPAIAAAILGGSRIWASTLTPSDYLIPIPPAVGAQHLPGLIVVTLALVAAGKNTVGVWVRPMLFGTSLVTLLMLLDVEALYTSMVSDTTEFAFHWVQNSPALFLLCDSLLAQLWLPKFERRRLGHWLIVVALPMAYAAAVLTANKSVG